MIINENLNASSENQIDLYELINILIHGKLLIIYLTSIFTIIALLYSLLLPNIYETEALIAPKTSENNNIPAGFSSLASITGINSSSGYESNTLKALEKMQSLSFFENNFLPNIFLPNLMAVTSWDPKSALIEYDKNIYDNSSKKWVRDFSYPQKLIPSSQESFEKFNNNHINIDRDMVTGFIRVKVKHQSPIVAKKWAELFVDQINLFFRLKDKDHAQRSLEYLKRQINNTTLIEIKDSVASLIQIEVKKLTLIEVDEFYVFEYIDRPTIKEIKSEPNRLNIVIVGFLFGIIISIITLIIRHYKSNIVPD